MLSSLSPSPKSAADDSVKDVSLSTFKADVLEASKQALVLVEFWATWCGPCKQLMPVLEKLARASNGVVKLAKIDIDQNQPIAQQMGVQSVPSVFAFYQGRPIDGFAGALPESQVKIWIDQLIKTTGAAAPGDDAVGFDTALQQAADFLTAKDTATARAIYADILEQEPAHAAAYAGLVRCLLDENNITAARQMFDAAPPDIATDKTMVPLRAALELAEQAGQTGSVSELKAKLAANPDDHQSRFELALAYYAAEQREAAVDELLGIVRRARSWNEDAARKHLVKFFEAFGMMDPLTVATRKRLSAMLFS